MAKSILCRGHSSNIEQYMRNINLRVCLYAVYALKESEPRGVWWLDERNEECEGRKGEHRLLQNSMKRNQVTERDRQRDIILRMAKRDRKIIRDK